MKTAWQHISDGVTVLKSGEQLKQYGSPIGRFIFTTRSADVVVPEGEDDMTIIGCVFHDAHRGVLFSSGVKTLRLHNNLFINCGVRQYVKDFAVNNSTIDSGATA